MQFNSFVPFYTYFHKANFFFYDDDTSDFINPNTEEQIVQAMAGVLAYNLDENDKKINFDYTNSNIYQNSHNIEDELEL